MSEAEGADGDSSGTKPPKGKDDGWKTARRTLVILFTLGLVAYYVYVATGHEPALLTTLTTSYSFSDLVAKAISLFGEATLFAIITGYIALAAFFTSIPSSGGFAASSPRVAGLFLINSLATWALVVFVLVGLLVLPGILISTVFLYLPLALVSIYATSAINTDSTYQELEDTTQGAVVSVIETFFMKRMVLPNTLLVIIILELVYFANNNPSYPLMAWLLLFFALSGAFLIVSQAYGTGYMIMTAKFVDITKTDGTKERCYVISKGSDHYIIQTEQKILLVPSSFVKEIEVVKRTKTTGIFSRWKRS